jgi:hypothetical protein
MLRKAEQGAACLGGVQDDHPVEQAFFLGASARAMPFIRHCQKDIASTKVIGIFADAVGLSTSNKVAYLQGARMAVFRKTILRVCVIVAAEHGERINAKPWWYEDHTLARS